MAKRTPKTAVDGQLLRWARAEAGYSLSDAARLGGVDADRLKSWEDGDDRPTLAQLRKLADRYGRTLAFFFLTDRPASDMPGVRDFRNLADRSLGPELRKEMRKVERRRQVLLDLDNPPAWRLNEVEVVENDLLRAVEPVRDALGITLQEQLAQADAPTALRWWIAVLERAGAAVFQMSRISSTECRGFSVYHDVLPLIVVNGGETESARIFTLLHELAHLLLRSGAVCVVWSDQLVERLCNAFAAEMLMPRELVMQLPATEDADADIAMIASRFNVSLEAAAIRLHEFSRIGQDDVDRVRSDAERRTQERKRKQREARGGPPHHRTHLRNLGDSYVLAVLDAYRSDQIDFTDAATYLEAKVGTVERMETELERKIVAQ